MQNAENIDSGVGPVQNRSMQCRSMTQQPIVARSYGGLCNNLKCVLSAMHVAATRREGAHEASDDISVNPGRPGVVTECQHLARIFENLDQRPEADYPESSAVATWRLLLAEDDDLPPGFASRTESKGFADADKAGRNIDFEYHRIPSSIRRTFLTYLRSLEVRSDLAERIERAAEELVPPGTESLHLRTWLTDDWDRFEKRHAIYFDEVVYESLIEQCERVFVASDNAGALQRLIRKFGDKIKYLVPDPDMHAFDRAFIELMLLSRGSRLIGSSLSTFTEMAWWLGGCCQPVTLVGAHGRIFHSDPGSK